ncbi:MAG: 3-phosphoshikimate 1-carboxyvinyltransferase [Rhodospirillaceae bacterium]|nr:3-phosphoshikimate 1-carboxyvinyltransferase [Rhodospirillaceae bacterium]
MTKIIARNSTRLRGVAQIPGDKSISHRSIILSALAIGESVVEGLLESQDVLHTIDAMRAFGAKITKQTDDTWSIQGRGVGGLDEPPYALNLGNSGTGVRLLLGVAASNPINTFFIGDDSLSGRPMNRVIAPLKMMGANFVSREGGRLPLACTGPLNLHPIHYTLPVASAQVKSAILLAALNSAGETSIIEPIPTRDHTELMLKQFGANVKIEQNREFSKTITLTGEAELVSQTVKIPADPSSAAFPIVAGLITPDSKIEINNICINPLRSGVFEILTKMGAKIEITEKDGGGSEPVADIIVHSSELRGINVPASIAPRMIDEYPILAVAAAFAEGTTVMTGLSELRVKESDRLSAIANGLQACGVKVDETADSLTVYGNNGHVTGGAQIQANMDHRIAMSFLILGLASESPVTIDNGETIDTSFPNFVDLMSYLGGNINSEINQKDTGQ